MIATTIYTHQAEGKIVFEENDFSIVNISSEDWILPSDIDLLIESIMDLDTENLKSEEWYQFTFKRVYEDDGSGAKNALWFDLVESIIITT